jgi:hypothetical protein
LHSTRWSERPVRQVIRCSAIWLQIKYMRRAGRAHLARLPLSRVICSRTRPVVMKPRLFRCWNHTAHTNTLCSLGRSLIIKVHAWFTPPCPAVAPPARPPDALFAPQHQHEINVKIYIAHNIYRVHARETFTMRWYWSAHRGRDIFARGAADGLFSVFLFETSFGQTNKKSDFVLNMKLDCFNWTEWLSVSKWWTNFRQ